MKTAEFCSKIKPQESFFAFLAIMAIVAMSTLWPEFLPTIIEWSINHLRTFFYEFEDIINSILNCIAEKKC